VIHNAAIFGGAGSELSINAEAEGRRDGERWSRLGSNQRPPACEAGALPLSYETGAERRTRTKISTRSGTGRKYRVRYWSGAPMASRNLCGPAQVDYRRASHRATISSVARGCSAVGSASPCQGEGRGFESRHPLEGAVASNPAVEWPSGEATACKAVHTGSIPVSTSRSVSPARLAQRESASLTRKRSLVQSQYRAPKFNQFSEGMYVYSLLVMQQPCNKGCFARIIGPLPRHRLRLICMPI